jgi:hypothetical protein
LNNQRNLLLAVVLCGLLLFGWEAAMKWAYPHAPEPAAKSAATTTAAAPEGDAKKVVRTREGGLTDPAAEALENAISPPRSPAAGACRSPRPRSPARSTSSARGSTT